MFQQDDKPAAVQPASFDETGGTGAISHLEEDDVEAPKGSKRLCGFSGGILERLGNIAALFRRRAKRVITHDWFDQAVVGLILVNCVFLALDDPTLEVSDTLCLASSKTRDVSTLDGGVICGRIRG